MIEPQPISERSDFNVLIRAVSEGFYFCCNGYEFVIQGERDRDENFELLIDLIREMWLKED